MISQRRMAQIGLLSAAAVFVISMGVLMSHGDNSPARSAGSAAAVASNSHQNSSLPIALSASPEKP
jgi:hypothetical protein